MESKPHMTWHQHLLLFPLEPGSPTPFRHSSHYHLNHSPPPPVATTPWKNCLLWNQSMAPKSLGTPVLECSPQCCNYVSSRGACLPHQTAGQHVRSPSPSPLCAAQGLHIKSFQNAVLWTLTCKSVSAPSRPAQAVRVLPCLLGCSYLSIPAGLASTPSAVHLPALRFLSRAGLVHGARLLSCSASSCKQQTSEKSGSRQEKKASLSHEEAHKSTWACRLFLLSVSQDDCFTLFLHSVLLSVLQWCAGRCLTTGSLELLKAPVCRGPWFLQCQYSHHGQFQAPNLLSLNAEMEEMHRSMSSVSLSTCGHNFPVAQWYRICLPVQEMGAPGLGRFPVEGNGSLLQNLSRRIPWTEEPGGLQSMGLQRLGRDWATEHAACNLCSDFLDTVWLS